jgi:RNA polymerase sigma-70 factor, ECF subfamily
MPTLAGEEASMFGDAPRTIEAPSSLDELYDRYGDAVYRQAQSLLRDSDRARDTTQDVFLRAAQYPIGMSTHPLPWLFRVTKNLCLNHIRDSRRRGELLRSHSPEPRREHGADARLAWNQLLAQLPEDLQQIAVSYYIDELSQEEIAAVHGVSRRTIGNRLAAFQSLAIALFEPSAA